MKRRAFIRLAGVALLASAWNATGASKLAALATAGQALALEGMDVPMAVPMSVGMEAPGYWPTVTPTGTPVPPTATPTPRPVFKQYLPQVEH